MFAFPSGGWNDFLNEQSASNPFAVQSVQRGQLC
jgi:hypothetical protein